MEMTGPYAQHPSDFSCPQRWVGPFGEKLGSQDIQDIQDVQDVQDILHSSSSWQPSHLRPEGFGMPQWDDIHMAPSRVPVPQPSPSPTLSHGEWRTIQRQGIRPGGMG